MSASNVRRSQPEPGRDDGPGGSGSGLSARDAAVARKVHAGNTGYVVNHDLISHGNQGWLKNRVITPEDLVDADLDDNQTARLDRLGAWRAATAEELQAAADAQKAAGEAGEEFEGYYVPSEQEPEQQAVSAQVGERA